jgi:transcriptional regulator with XRE-family HTH domain
MYARNSSKSKKFLQKTNMTIQERIKQIRVESGLTQEEFAEKIGLKRGNYSQIELGRQMPTFEVITQIARNFNKSYAYLIEGHEEPSKNVHLTVHPTVHPKEAGAIESYTKKGDKVKNGANALSKAAPPIEHVIDTTGLKVIPILDVRAAAGVSGVLNPDYITEEDVIRLPATMIKSGLHASIRIKGPSMAPTLQDGGYLVIRYLEPSEWQNMKSENIYFVVDQEGAAYVKRVKNRLSADKGFIVCTSDNPDKVSHPNFNLQYDEISHIWRAEWYFSAKMPNIHDTYFNRVSNLEDQVQLLANEVRSIKTQIK